LKRLADTVYNARKAHQKAYVARTYAKFEAMKIRKDMKLEQYITTYLRNGWSPEQIAGALAKQRVLEPVSHTTIYKWLRSVYGRRLEAELDYLKQKRKKKHRQKVVELAGRIFIDKRLKTIGNRARYGDWEGDFIVSGKGKQTVLLVLHERKSRYVLLRKLTQKTAAGVEQALVEMTRDLPHFRSLTLDNDVAFVHHEHISAILGVPIYFCHPYASWEKGGVENSNAYVRRFIPKGSDIGTWSDLEIAEIEQWMNTLPRKVLDFCTPEEVMVQKGQIIKSYVQCL
jgi:IS30 family transposase